MKTDYQNIDSVVKRLEPKSNKDEGEIDQDYLNLEAVRSRHFFMNQKESSFVTNKKLREFYETLKEESEVSVFTMAENAI